jgi:hypothetical protein
MPKLAWLRLGLLAALFTPLAAYAQVTNPQILPVSSAPTGACTTVLPIRLQTPNGGLYTCQNGTWGSIGTTGGPAFAVPISAPDAVLKLPRTDVRWFGAVGDGATDNCTALTNAATYALSVGAVLYFPPSTAYFGTSCTVPFLGNWIVDGDGPMTLSGGTAASTALVSTGTSQTPNHVGIYGPGTINGNSLSPVLVWVMQGHHVNIAVSNIINLAVNGKGVYWGDDAGVGAGGNEGFVSHVGFGLSLGLTPGPAGSTCVYISGGNGTQGSFTDDNVSYNVLHNCSIGWQDHVGGNNYFSFNHAWDTVMTACFDEYAGGGTLAEEYCDSPTTYGFHIRGLLTRILGGTAYMGTSGPDDVATAIQFDQSTEPQAMVNGIRIYGSTSNRWAADTNLGFNATKTTWCNIFDESNVVTKQNGTGTCIFGFTGSSTTASQINFGSTWLKNGGMYTGNSATYSCTSACAFSSGSNWQKATLSANATSTFTISTPGSNAAFSNFTFMVCQPATGGPFTLAWPSNSTGGGTIGTGAGLCSVQNFMWDGTTLRASSPIQTNE